MCNSGRARFELSDEQWQTIATPVGLPDAARSQVEAAIELFRAFQDGARSYRPQGDEEKVGAA